MTQANDERPVADLEIVGEPAKDGEGHTFTLLFTFVEGDPEELLRQRYSTLHQNVNRVSEAFVSDGVLEVHFRDGMVRNLDQAHRVANSVANALKLIRRSTTERMLEQPADESDDMQKMLEDVSDVAGVLLVTTASLLAGVVIGGLAAAAKRPRS